MRIWAPVTIVICALSGLFSWMSLRIGAPGPLWKLEGKSPPGKLEFEAKNVADYRVAPLQSSAILVNAGKREIHQVHTIEIPFRNVGSGPVELVWVNTPACGCVLPVEINGKALQARGEGAVIGPNQEGIIKVQWKPGEKQLPDAERKSFTFTIYIDVRNDPQFFTYLGIQVDCIPVLPSGEGSR